MIYKIVIVSKIESNAFNMFGYEFIAKYVSDETKTITGYSEVIDKIPTKHVVTGNDLIIDISPVKCNEFKIGEFYTVQGILSLHCNNPVHNAVLAITKVL